MFNLNKLIQMVKKGELLKKPFNIRKKAEDEGDTADIYEQEDISRSKGEEEEGSYDGGGGGGDANRGEVDIVTKNIDLGYRNKVEKIMDEWLATNAGSVVDILAQDSQVLQNNLDNPKNSLINPEPDISEAMRSYPEFIDIFSNKIKQNVVSTSLTPEMSDKVDIFVNTMLAKYNDSVFKRNKIEEIPQVFQDNITQSVLTRFDPIKLKETGEYDLVLDALRSKGEDVGKGTGSMYGQNAFNDAVNKMFGVPQGNNIDQRMNFFLINSDLLNMPYFPKEAPQKNIFQQVPGLEDKLREGLKNLGIVHPDVTEGLRVAVKQTAVKSESRNSPRGMITKLLKLHAEPELLEILQQLIGSLDPRIVQWFKSKLAYVGSETGKEKISLDELETNRGIPKGQDIPDLAPTTEEEKEHATMQVGAVIESYLGDQLETMDLMKESIVTKLMDSESDKYMELKKALSQVDNKKDKRQIENEVKRQIKKYTVAEFLNGFAIYAIEKIGEIFAEEGLGNRKKYVGTGGKKKNTNVSYKTDFGEGNVPSIVVNDIFRKDDGSERVTARDYVAEYVREINSGKRSDPWTLDWAKAVNYRVPYNMFADMYMIKSQIKQAYKTVAEGNISTDQTAINVSEEGFINKVYNYLNENAESRDMLETFSGITVDDREIPATVLQKKKNFIRATLDQTSFNLKTHKSCYEAREIYNNQRALNEGDESITEEEREKKRDEIIFEERAGVLTDKPQMKIEDGEEVPVILLNGKPQMIRLRSVLKHIKGKIGESLEPLLPRILKAIQNSQATTVIERLAENNFMQLFNHRGDRFEAYGTLGKKINPYDEKKRTNTELYQAILNDGVVPKTVGEIGDFTKKSKGTGYDKKYLANLKNIFKIKKKVRSDTKSLLARKTKRKNHIMYNLNPAAAKKVQMIVNEKDPEVYNNLIKDVPKDKIEEFNKEVINGWNGKTELRDKYYLWLGLFQPMKSKATVEDRIGDFEDDIRDALLDIKKIEESNKLLAPQTSLNRAHASGSCLRMVYAEYNKALSRIDKLCKIKKFSYKFASVDISSIDDTISGIEKDFENLLDNLIR